jgi:hypothetical protein
MSRRAGRLVGGRLVLPGLAAGTLTLLFAQLALGSTSRTDYSIEAQPAFDALRSGHVGQFLDLAPAYGGAMIMRAPLALLPGLWGGGSLDVYRAVSAPALIALCAFGVWLWGATLDAGGRRRAAWGALFLIVLNPLAFMAVATGHSEEILVGLACIAAALAACRGHTMLAAVLFGVAVAAKPWAIVAVGPLLLVVETGRVRFLAVAGAVGAAILAPIILHGGTSVHTTASIARSTGDLANPWQVWWFFGDHAGPVHRTLGRVFHDYRTEPVWVTRSSHPLVVAVPLAICLLRFRVLRGRPRHDVLLLLAALFMTRCLLDTWNHHYYALPAVLALAMWEVVALGRGPVAAFALTTLSFVSIVIVPGLATADVEAVLYLLWAVPFTVALLIRAFAPERWPAIARRSVTVPGGRTATSRPAPVAVGRSR